MSENEGAGHNTPGRWQRREQRRASERNRIAKHGAGLQKVYRDAILKRMRSKKRK